MMYGCTYFGPMYKKKQLRILDPNNQIQVMVVYYQVVALNGMNGLFELT